MYEGTLSKVQAIAKGMTSQSGFVSMETLLC